MLLGVYFGHSGCPAQQTVLALTILLCLFTTAVSISKLAPHGTLLTSASVSAYATFLAYSALSSHPDEACNPLADSGSSTSGLVVGLVVAAVSMASTAWGASESQPMGTGKAALVGKEPGSSELDAPLDGGGGAKSDGGADGGEGEPEDWWYFHFMMVACALYMAMLLTDWTYQPARDDGVPVTLSREGNWSVGLGSFWTKLVSQWAALLLYAWTLLAPWCFRETRDFGIDFDD